MDEDFLPNQMVIFRRVIAAFLTYGAVVVDAIESRSPEESEILLKETHILVAFGPIIHIRKPRRNDRIGVWVS
jgi:hypothetical protein